MDEGIGEVTRVKLQLLERIHQDRAGACRPRKSGAIDDVKRMRGPEKVRLSVETYAYDENVAKHDMPKGNY